MTTGVTDHVFDSIPATDYDITVAQIEAERAIEREAVKEGDVVSEGRSLPGTVKPLTYKIPESDRGAWVMGWELKVDRDGNEYGIPCRMPRQQVGLWLTKKREEDGGRRFSVQPPARVAATPQYECFIGSCRKRVYERVWLIQHIRVNHPVEAGAYTEFITQLEKSIAADNPRMRQLVEDIINRNDEGLASVPFDGPRLAEQVDTSAGKPIVTHLGIRRTEPEDYACQFEGCGWQPKEDVQKPEVALRQHTYVKHKGEDL